MSDMEGKVTRVGVSKPGGERVSILSCEFYFRLFASYFLLVREQLCDLVNASAF